MANPLNDIAKALGSLTGSLAVLPDMGRHMRRMAADVRLMREAVQLLPEEMSMLRESVDALHADMNRMVSDVAELKGLEEQLTGVRTDLQRLPFIGGRRARAAGGQNPGRRAGDPPAA